MGGRTVRYLGLPGVAALFGVQPGTVSKWLARYEGWPGPDADTDGAKGWLPERETEWRAWKGYLPGHGAAGGPKPRRPDPRHAGRRPKNQQAKTTETSE